MFIGTVIVSALLAALLVFSAGLKLSHKEEVVQMYAKVAVPEDKLNYLAIVLLAGAVGVIAGLFWAPIGVAAAIGVILYFTGAVVAHLRVRDAKSLPAPLTYLGFGVAALVLRLLTM